ncbi:unnamed protein product [Adineta steineri]|uniref:TBC1 domain family member 15 n=1 Tax=Adineta steineri TaxID=433720 RepID=A0A818UHL5_9BILA|nr:unnamed protein product [Adineta steineri]CAF3505427.1 unnamed protein product [Adineta steineri]CAF3698168.1 unnamed protein product [Adineta steineri]
MPKDKILFERKQIIIKERSPQSQAQAAPLDEITGTITIIENERGNFFRYVPLGLEDVMTDDWALINGVHSITSNKNDGDSTTQSSSPLLKFRFNFNLHDLRSVRRHHMLHGIAHMVFILKDGTTLPAFYFNLGGSKELLQKLAQCLRLEKSTQDARLYIVKDDLPKRNLSQSLSAFDQLNLFDSSNDVMRRLRGNDPRRTTVERFSKVTQFVKDTFLGQNEFITTNENSNGLLAPDVTALTNSINDEIRESNNDGFEVIYKVDFKKKLPDVARGQPVTIKEWQTFFDKDGRAIDVDKLKERIYRGGLESNILRREVWKFLLNFYPWSSTREERIEILKKRKTEYFDMKVQWKSMNEQQKQRNASFRDRESLIDKDVARTDRTHEFYQDDNSVHLQILRDVLMTYNMYNFDLGYVQGMNDLLSPILIVMEEEVDAFWCFVGLMSRMEKNFHLDQAHIKSQLSNLHTLLQFIDAELANYLTENNSSNMYFFFRWMLICFKREFSFDDVMYLWEVIWTDYLCQNFDLLVCLAILLSQKTVIMESKFGCNEILKYFNDLSCNLDLDTCLLSAEKLYIQLATHRDIPTSIAKLLGLPTGPNQQLIATGENITYPRKIYTRQPHGTMNLDNSYFRQESEPSLLIDHDETTSAILDELLNMTPLMEL